MLGRTIGKVGLGGRRTAWAYTVLAQQDTGQHAVLLGLKRAGTRARLGGGHCTQLNLNTGRHDWLIVF